MSFTVNFKDVDKLVGDFPLIKAGTYALEIDEAEFSMSSAGKPMLKIRFVITDSEEEDNEEFIGQKLFRNFSLSEKALPWLLDFLTKLGFDENDLKSEEVDPEEVAETMVGESIVGIVIQKAHYKESGKFQNEISKFISADDIQPETDEEEEVEPVKVMKSAQKLIDEYELDVADIDMSDETKGITKKDVEAHIAEL